MKLNQLIANPGARTKRTRVGRGIGSTKGKTAGRGVKGQKARTGVSLNGFEGGQSALFRRLPKVGFTSINRKTFVEINLGTLQQAIDAKKLDTAKVIDAKALIAAGVIKKEKDGVRLLAKGSLKSKVTLNITGASKAAVEAVEKAGGKVDLIVRSVAPVVRKKKIGAK
jgi:large subunit ribosomal protein L15